MLRTGSIEIAGQQRALYDGILDFVEALSVWPGTAALVYYPRPIYSSTDGSLLDVSFEAPEAKGVAKPNATSDDKGQALITLLEPLSTQGQSIIDYVNLKPSWFMQDPDQREILDISLRICRVWYKLRANEKDLPINMRPRTEQSSGTKFTDWVRKNSVIALDDEDMLTGFKFEGEARSASGTTTHLGRMKRLVTELATLQSSLPEGIFVRHGSSRLDVMRLLIVGPAGTPYELGFFEFDLFCPPEYPKVPPKMWFLTTNTGLTRFNPNLYEDGKGKWDLYP